jgi:septal ring factor EnvC (AmiA/AmiB activator)
MSDPRKIQISRQLEDINRNIENRERTIDRLENQRKTYDQQIERERNEIARLQASRKLNAGGLAPFDDDRMRRESRREVWH